MANLIEVTDTTKIKPLGDAKVRRYTASAAITAGWPVYIYSDGTIRLASGTAAASNRVIGVAITAIASGARGDVVIKGPILCLTGATPGSRLLPMNSAGGMDHTGGTKKTTVGVAETAEILFVRPRMGDLS